LAGRTKASHGPRVGADCQHVRIRRRVEISIHGPRVGADQNAEYEAALSEIISIHGPRVGADVMLPDSYRYTVISIHGPRVGADCRRAG